MLARYFAVFGEQALDRKKKRNIFLYGTLFPGVILLLPILLVMLQKHLSCIIILGAIGLLTILAAGVGTRYIGIFTALGGVGVTCLALFTDYTKERITVWQNPEAYPLTGGWQTLQGLMAIGSGGLFGLGLGKSVLKYCDISEPIFRSGRGTCDLRISRISRLSDRTVRRFRFCADYGVRYHDENRRAGLTERRGRHKYHTEHGDFPAFFQLWRFFARHALL